MLSRIFQRFTITIALAFVLGFMPGCGGQRFPYRKLVQTEKPISILIQNVQIFDGQTNALSAPCDVLIGLERILKITPAGQITEKAEIMVDGTGKVLMPGLIDTHVHLGGSGSAPWSMVKANVPYNLEAYLYAGITTVYELGGLASKSKKMDEKVAKGSLPGPRIFYTHFPLTVEGSHPIPLGVATSPFPLNKIGPKLIPKLEVPFDAVEYADKYKEMGVHYMKISCDQIPPGSKQMNDTLLKAAVEAAHRVGLKAIVHIGSAENAISAVKAGADVLAHGPWRSPLSPEQADRIAASGVKVIYTLAGFENVEAIHCGHFHPAPIDTFLVPPAVLDPVSDSAGKQIAQVPVMGEFAADVHAKKQYWQSNFDLLRSRGVRILVGTDSALPGTWPGATYYQEMKLLKEYGLSNYDILLGATSEAAKMFLAKPEFGVVKKDFFADLLLLNANPLENLEAVESPEMIIARGRIVKRQP